MTQPKHITRRGFLQSGVAGIGAAGVAASIAVKRGIKVSEIQDRLRADGVELGR